MVPTQLTLDTGTLLMLPAGSSDILLEVTGVKFVQRGFAYRVEQEVDEKGQVTVQVLHFSSFFFSLLVRTGNSFIIRFFFSMNDSNL